MSARRSKLLMLVAVLLLIGGSCSPRRPAQTAFSTSPLPTVPLEGNSHSESTGTPSAFNFSLLLILGVMVIAMVVGLLAFRNKIKNLFSKTSQGSAPGTRPLSDQKKAPPQVSMPKKPFLELRGDRNITRRHYVLSENMTVGRAEDNILVITPDFSAYDVISAYHARFSQLGNHWMIEDLASTNGIYVNGRRTGVNLIRDGWEINIGRTTFVFHNPGEFA